MKIHGQKFMSVKSHHLKQTNKSVSGKSHHLAQFFACLPCSLGRSPKKRVVADVQKMQHSPTIDIGILDCAGHLSKLLF